LGILAAVAEDEGRRISERTRKALEMASQRGTKLGGYKGRNPTDSDRKRATAAVRARADERAQALAPVLDDLRQQGIVSTTALADALNNLGIPTPRNGRWHPSSAARLLARLAA